VCASITNNFEGAEYKRNILNKWNNIILKSIMHKTENERKFMNECLQLLIKELRHLQHDLGSVRVLHQAGSSKDWTWPDKVRLAGSSHTHKISVQ
jgi:hypothetical protein